ncbi:MULTISPECIES: hypothetical protein [unclassified Micromonospora]|uniref:hypothetical protein n=1 Tax=unclassified Micromonospora TaxID=2617518 RepID=UPI001B37A781|nr:MULTISPECIES: hypothetical protein [unclassified Micromonospora]MBQ1043199.1 hypothetical protein [Micromonospora sp. C72]MBQ1056580.1 hypothetical protein [Micromonospora sp. C32]
MTVEMILIRYRVRPERLTEHLRLLRAVHDELARLRPSGFRYVSYRLDDERSFVEVATAPELPGPLPQLESFRRFRAGLEERCEERETFEPTVALSYGFGE